MIFVIVRVSVHVLMVLIVVVVVVRSGSGHIKSPNSQRSHLSCLGMMVMCCGLGAEVKFIFSLRLDQWLSLWNSVTVSIASFFRAVTFNPDIQQSSNCSSKFRRFRLFAFF